jgi:hypothetical protein
MGAAMAEVRISMLLVARAWARCSRGTIWGSRLCMAGPVKARLQPNSTSTA